jgi:hypothetical protein
MQPGRQRVGLVAGFAVQRDDPARGEAPIRAEQYEFFRHDPNAVVRHHDDAKEPQDPTVTQC